MNILFVCSQNKWRSPTAEQIFSARNNIEVDSAGTNNDAENPLSRELIEWSDIIFVMEKTHRQKIQRKYQTSLRSKRIICLDIPDRYKFMDPRLVELLETKMKPYLPMV